jgi:hypothetical protein
MNMDQPIVLPILDSTEIRVLGALMEKSKTTPDYYPMTVNSLTAACNQKTSRKPVVNYDEETVTNALNSLKRRGLVNTATGGGSRSIKYKHNFSLVFPIDNAGSTIICLLLLRGPQTAGELNTNSGRMFEFESLEEVQLELEKLSTPELPFVQQLPRRPGQKETRYTHLLSGAPDLTVDESEEEVVYHPTSELEDRLSKVEAELAEVKATLDKLVKELMG